MIKIDAIIVDEVIVPSEPLPKCETIEFHDMVYWCYQAGEVIPSQGASGE